MTARLVEEGYESVQPSTVVMSVIELLMLHPSAHVYAAPAVMVNYGLLSFKGKKERVLFLFPLFPCVQYLKLFCCSGCTQCFVLLLQAVPMPSPQYKWSSTNFSVASIDPDNGRAVTTALGSTLIVAADLEVEENRVFLAPCFFFRVRVSSATSFLSITHCHCVLSGGRTADGSRPRVPSHHYRSAGTPQ